MKTFLLAAALSGAVQASAAEPDIWRACTVEQVSVCTPTGCASGRPTIWLYLASYEDAGRRHTIYMRCAANKQGCDNYTPVVQRSGAYLNFALPQNGVVSKLGPDDAVTDVATMMDTVIISRGKCRNEPPPLIRLDR